AGGQARAPPVRGDVVAILVPHEETDIGRGDRLGEQRALDLWIGQARGGRLSHVTNVTGVHPIANTLPRLLLLCVQARHRAGREIQPLVPPSVVSSRSVSI